MVFPVPPKKKFGTIFPVKASTRFIAQSTGSATIPHEEFKMRKPTLTFSLPHPGAARAPSLDPTSSPAKASIRAGEKNH